MRFSITDSQIPLNLLPLDDDDGDARALQRNFQKAGICNSVSAPSTVEALDMLRSEPSMRGRVMALRLAVALDGTPIGAPLVGWIANHFSPRWALGVGPLSGLFAAGVAVASLPSRARQDAISTKTRIQPVGPGCCKSTSVRF